MWGSEAWLERVQDAVAVAGEEPAQVLGRGRRRDGEPLGHDLQCGDPILRHKSDYRLCRGSYTGGRAEPGNVACLQYDESMPKPTKQTVLDWLGALGFSESAVGSDQWELSFPQHNLVLTVDLRTGRISYGPEIKVVRQTVTNLHDEENLVVLECVVALLRLGYKPSTFELEAVFPLGRRAGGYLDILIRNEDRTYLMIECKTWGDEFAKELQKLTTQAGSQLMSYVQQDRAAEHAVLYSSRIHGKKVERKYAGFACAPLLGANTAELFANWNKELYSTGVFDTAPYMIAEQAIRVKDLTDLTNEDGQALFNQFKEILRRHAVSDLANAFNKLFNLFICKIIDEDKTKPNQQTDFQWGGSEQPVDVLERLSRLYERGMREYLKLDVADAGSAISVATEGLEPVKAAEIERLVSQLRQYSNTNFAFIDVYDRASYDLNASIVRDLVRLLQLRRLRYTQKQGFMGMFFERLLSTSMKQEAGQFFTPPPIAQFVNESLPIEQLIEGKIEREDPNFLPYGIDYAAGSGHFLTEFMDRVDRVIRVLDKDALETKTQRANIDRWSTGLAWAGEFVYGIELDYRLAKTAKVSTFLHGDGDANVIRANGLGSFSRDPEFIRAGGKLRGVEGKRDNQQFDVVVANPPYSVPGFAQQVSHGAESFDLWPLMGDRSDDIECLFVERTKQLLNDGGVAGIVLPTSLLNNPSLEMHTRAMLLRYFDIVALVSLHNRVFIATTTPCTILFLRRKSTSEVERVGSAVANFMSTGATASIKGIAEAFELYAHDIHGVGASELHAALVKGVDTGVEIIDDYEWLSRSSSTRATRREDGTASPHFAAIVRTTEAARMEAYFATLGQRTVVAVSPSPIEQQTDFLGYSFSERRRHEGIHFRSGTDTIVTPLFDPDDSDNPEKISTLIKRQFEGIELDIPNSLSPWVRRYDTAELVGLSDLNFKWSIRATPMGATSAFSVPTERLNTVCALSIGSTPTRERPDLFKGALPWAKITDFAQTGYPSKSPIITKTSEHITDEAAATMTKVPAGTLLLSFKLSIGRTAFAGNDMYTNEAIVALRVKDSPAPDAAWIDRDYLDVLLRRVGPQLLGIDQAHQKKFGQTLTLAHLNAVRIPVGDSAYRDAIKAIDRDSSMDDAEKTEAIASRIW